MRYPAYPNYKPSGVEWLGDVPGHWEALRFKLLFRDIYRYPTYYEIEYVDEGVPEVRGESLIDGRIERLPDQRFISEETNRQFPRTILQEGDLVMSVRGTMGKVGLVSPTFAGANITANLLRLSPRRDCASGMYLSWLMRSEFFLKALDRQSPQTTIQTITMPQLASIRLPIPPLPEQRVIVEYLDRETAKLDTLMAKKRALIEKLKEKRTALISHTVTRGLPPEASRAAGLDPYPKLKPSGIEWLGEVPEHWEVKQLKWAVMFQRGHDLPADDREEGLVPLVSSSGVSATHSRAAARGPGIVTGRYGTIGQFYLVKEDYWPLNTALYSIDLHGNEPRFLQLMLTHLSPLFLLNAVKSAVPGVDRNDIHPIRAAVPPVSEQRAIADYLDRETTKIDRMVSRVEAAIERLQEYRTALITEVVTGKVDVRGATA